MNIITKYPDRSPDTAWRIIEEEAVVVIPQEGLVRVLNNSGAKIWSLLDGRNTIGVIAKEIAGEFEVSLEEACRDTLDFLNELQIKRMVVLRDGPVV